MALHSYDSEVVMARDIADWWAPQSTGPGSHDDIHPFCLDVSICRTCTHVPPHARMHAHAHAHAHISTHVCTQIVEREACDNGPSKAEWQRLLGSYGS